MKRFLSLSRPNIRQPSILEQLGQIQPKCGHAAPETGTTRNDCLFEVVRPREVLLAEADDVQEDGHSHVRESAERDGVLRTLRGIKMVQCNFLPGSRGRIAHGVQYTFVRVVHIRRTLTAVRRHAS